MGHVRSGRPEPVVQGVSFRKGAWRCDGCAFAVPGNARKLGTDWEKNGGPKMAAHVTEAHAEKVGDRPVQLVPRLRVVVDRPSVFPTMPGFRRFVPA